MELLRELSSGKAIGLDGLIGESLKYANHILPSICFTSMFKHCYLLIVMRDSVIVPLVKNRNSDLSDKNDYCNRPIALSSVISKVFGLTGESLKYANHILPSICFPSMFKHCYLPIVMLDSVIVPLVKNRNSDLSDKNDYCNRSIALTSVISKVFENVIVYRLEGYL